MDDIGDRSWFGFFPAQYGANLSKQPSGALMVALLHITGTLGAMANADRLPRFQDKAFGSNRMRV